MNKVKRGILNEATNNGSRNSSNANNDATDATTSTTLSTTDVIARSSDTYIYGVGIVPVLAIGACVFLSYNKRFSQTTNKEQVKEPVGHVVQPIKPPIQCSMF